MRIYSKFKDYYDTALSFGIEETIRYKRETFEIEDDETIEKIEKIRDLMPSQDGFGTIVVLFCGKVYFGYLYETDTFCYSLNSIKSIKPEDKKSIFYDPNKFKSRWWRPRKEHFTEKNLNELFELSGKLETDLNKIHRTPLLVSRFYGDYVGTVRLKPKMAIMANDPLYPINFVSAVDPHTAFQEIQMFIGGVLGGEDPPMLEVSEKDKIASKGFDKWSFRNMPKNKRK